ncbi:thiamine-phosphate kinase [Limnohabitans sp. T6-20]|uniref:thiamine-phosphate kinase n=1 Tax=Limnohabitans sp. T6-20 TaxID=1100725 RepID=UPI000D3B25AE|nr:thiamine-phosphate kinase [Limnohabitans sp. T6-20]PUE12883.1 thiamine-phosphate kinase [Limnohabitans sp. T6-20]
MGEFELIERFFKRPPRRADVGIGDDCAVWSPRAGHQLAFSADMLVEGRHFLSTVDPVRLGHKALAVNLSDLAACGATPQAFLLSLSLPRADERWLAGFSQGLFELADAHGCELMGGDTTQGPLNIAITVMGEVPAGQAILRSGAQAGDDLYVSGNLGDARLALEAFRGAVSLPQAVFEAARLRMETPTPRIALGQALRGIAHAMADISDGLLGDLGHILKASHVGAEIELSATSDLMQTAHLWSCPSDLALTCILSGGDDYELVFCAPPSASASVQAAAQASGTRVTRIGRITSTPTLVLLDAQGQTVHSRFSSFDHFA